MKKLIVANWKMNPATPREAKELYAKIRKMSLAQTAAEVVICPPAVFLGFLNHKNSSRLSLGVQDIAVHKDAGAFTGSVSASQVRYAGAEYVIIGHSERRIAGDDSEIINTKVKLALAAKLKVILCVGEAERDEHGKYLDILAKQVETALAGVPKGFYKKIIIAYEPVWAVGRVALGADTPAEFLHHKLFIQKIISKLIGGKAAKEVAVLYGGSVNAKNAADFLRQGNADGLLVGRESLRADHFKQIIYEAR